MPTHGSCSPRLVDLLRGQRDALVRRSLSRIRQDPELSRIDPLSEAELVHNFSVLLDELADALAALPPSGSGEERGRALGSASLVVEHAHRRLRAGGSISNALRELSHLRAAIVDLGFGAGAAIRSQDAQLFRAMFDEIMRSVAAEMERINQADLADRETRLRLATEGAHLGTWDFDPTANTLRWDTLCKAISGFLVDAEVTFDAFIERVHPEDRERIHGLVQQALDPAGNGEYRAEYRVVYPEGSERWVAAHGRAFFDARGRAVRMLGVVIDVTDRKRAEGRLAEELKFRERFMGILGHDLRNPLTSITLSTAILVARADLPPDVTKSLRRIAASADRMARLVRDLLDVTRIRLGSGIQIVPAPADLQDVCRQIVDELRSAHPLRTILFDARGSGRGVWDADRLAQAVSNVLGNALAYSPPDTPVQVSVGEQGRMLVIAVHNDGPPIPREVMTTLFEPFHRGAPAPSGSPSARGLGLGLFICQQIVRAHRGAIEVTSMPDQGTTVTLSLPRSCLSSA